MLSALLMAGTVLAGGCAVTQDQNTPVWQQFEKDPASERGYWLYVPSSYRHDKPAKLIVTCHGTPPYDIAEHHIREMKMLGEKNDCMVVAPQLMATDGIFGDGPIAGMLPNERRILSIISSLGYRYNIDRNNIMITGFSGGGFPTYWVGLRHPEIFSAVVARNANFSRSNLEGWYPPEAKKIPIFVYYGENDPATIIVQSRNAIEFLRENQFNVTWRMLPGSGHERKPEHAMEFFRKNWRPPDPSLPDRRGRRFSRQ